MKKKKQSAAIENFIWLSYVLSGHSLTFFRQNFDQYRVYSWSVSFLTCQIDKLRWFLPFKKSTVESNGKYEPSNLVTWCEFPSSNSNNFMGQAMCYNQFRVVSNDCLVSQQLHNSMECRVAVQCRVYIE